jgi:PAS domain S-box-containing protein
MNIQTKINIFAFSLLALLAIPIVIMGYISINKIVYKLNYELYLREINDIHREIGELYENLKFAELLYLEDYVASNQQELFSKYNKYTYGETGYLYILDNNGRVVFHPYFPAQKLLNYPFVAEMLHSRNGQISYYLDNKAENRYAVFMKIPEWDWLLVISVSKDEIFQLRTNYMQSVILFTFLLFLLIMLLSHIFTRKISHRIDDILLFLKQVEYGNLDARIHVDSRDEIGTIQTGINAMVEKVSEVNRLMSWEIEQRKSTEQALRESQTILTNVLDNSPSVIFAKDLTWRITLANQQLAHLLKISQKNIIGKPDYTVFSNVEPLRKIDKQVIKTNQPIMVEESIDWGHEIRTYWTTTFPLFDNTRKLYGIGGILTDITDRKQAEAELQERESRYRNLFNSSPISLWEQDFSVVKQKINYLRRTGVSNFEKYFANNPGFVYELCSLIKIIDVNQATLDLYQAQNKEELIRHLPNLAEDYESFSNLFLALIQGDTRFVSEAVHKSLDNKIIHVAMQYSVLSGFENNYDKVLVLIIDITERKKFEAKLQQAKEVAELANRAKSTFLANMSHELRTPLNGVLGYAQILAKDKTLSENQLEGIKIIQRSGDYLLNLINDVLDLAKIEAGKIEIIAKAFDFSEFITGIVDLFKMRVMQKDISFDYQELTELPKVLLGDEKRLRQILINLLGNAVKFTEIGQVTLKVSYKHQQLYLEINDTGIGIDESELSKIFLPFHQVGDANYKAQGTGLGLAITQELIEKMGGKLQVTSKLGVGSKFYFSLPLMAVEHVELPTEITNQIVIGYKPIGNKINRYCILVVDDNYISRKLIFDLLSPLGFVVLQAPHGQVALNMLKEHSIDLIITELNMSIMTGFEMVRQIRSQNLLIPIFALSADVFEEQQQQSLQLGCDQFLPKPLQLPILLDKLKHYLALEWIYSTLQPTEIENLVLSDKEVLDLTSEQAAILLDLGMMGDVQGIFNYLSELEQNPALLPLTQELRHLAKDFMVDEICDYVRHFID